MGAASGPDMITDGLVLCLDAGSNESFKGEPTINLYAYYGFQAIGNGGTHSAVRYIGPAPDLNIPNNYDYFTCTTTSSWAAELNRWLPVMQSAGTPGVLDTNYFTISFYARVISQQTATIGASFYGNSLRSNGSDINFNLTDKWQRFSIYANAPTIYKNFEFGSRSGAIVFQVAGLQLESKTYTTPYVNNTRGNSVDTGGGLFDLTNRGNNGTLINGVRFNAANVGSLTFDGVDDYVSTPVTGTFSQISFDFWSFFDDPTLNVLSRQGSIFGDWNSNRVHFATRWTGSNAGMHWNVNAVWQTTSPTYLKYGWNLYTLVYDTVLNLKRVYLNGILSSSHGTNGNMVLGDFRIGVATNLNAYYRGNISNFKIYNRALTAAEIQQNYNALKGRFGI